MPGDYNTRIEGYAPDGSKVFETATQSLKISDNDLIEMFEGKDSVKLAEPKANMLETLER